MTDKDIAMKERIDKIEEGSVDVSLAELNLGKVDDKFSNENSLQSLKDELNYSELPSCIFFPTKDTNNEELRNEETGNKIKEKEHYSASKNFDHIFLKKGEINKPTIQKKLLTDKNFVSVNNSPQKKEKKSTPSANNITFNPPYRPLSNLSASTIPSSIQQPLYSNNSFPFNFNQGFISLTSSRGFPFPSHGIGTSSISSVPIVHYNNMPYIQGMNYFSNQQYNSAYTLNTKSQSLTPILPIHEEKNPKSLVSLNNSHIYESSDNESLKDSEEDESINTTEKVSKNSLAYLLSTKVNIYEQLFSQSKCKRIIKYLKKATKKEISLLFKDIYPEINSCLTNSIANYFCQSFFGYLSKKQKQKVWKQIFHQFKFFSCADYATHCVQALLEVTYSDYEHLIIFEYMQNDFIEIACHNRGTHVILKMLQCFEKESRKKLLSIIRKNCLLLSQQTYGVNIIKKLIIYSKNEDKKFKHDWIEVFCDNFLQMACDIHGNYAILCLLEEWGHRTCTKIINIALGNLNCLCFHRFGSRIIIKIQEQMNKVRSN
jgi:G:T/U-mismatch repair DNA glycosylase